MLQTIKNKLIRKLMKNTKLNALTCYAFVAKVPHDELRTYMKCYENDTRTDTEKFAFIFDTKKEEK